MLTFGSKMKRRTIIGLVALAAVTSPWWLFALYLGGASLWGRVDEAHYRPMTKFDAARWQKPERKYRYAVLACVAKNVVTQGMAEANVKALLGKPDMTDTNANWQYEARRPGWRPIDFSGGGILVHFDTNGTVQKVEINTWID